MPKNILVIDDDPLVLKTLTKYLKLCGYSVTKASSGAEALDSVKASKFDLIICDVRMSVMSGVETLRKIRELEGENKTSVPAIVITGYAGDESFRQDSALGIADYLYKPFEIDEFIKIVKKDLELSTGYKRQYPRISAIFPVKLKLDEPLPDLPLEISGETLTLSEGGLSLSAPYHIPVNSRLEVYIEPGADYPSIRADAWVMWSKVNEKEKEYYYGLSFLKIENDDVVAIQRILTKHKFLSEQFVYLTQELKSFVEEFKRQFDDFDKANPDQLARIEFLRTRREEIFGKLTRYFDEIWDIVKDFDKDRYIIHKDYYQRTLLPLLRDPAEVNRHIYNKPLGYPGDYIMMNYISDYNGDDNYLGNSSYEKLINNYTCSIPVSCSNVARKNFLKDVIAEIINQNKIPKIASIGCGSARELIELLKEGKINKQVLFKCLDLEVKALKYIENRIEKISLDKKRFLNLQYLHRDITSIIRDKKLKDEIRGNNLIYLSGVYDYLSDRMAERLTGELYSLLEKDGKMVICNMSLENAKHRAYYELLGEWCMVHRSKEKMLGWITGFEGAQSEFVHPLNGDSYNFLVINKLLR